MANEQQTQSSSRRGGPLGGGPMGHGFEKAKDFRKTIQRLMGRVAQYRLHLLGVVVCALVSTAFTIIGPRMLGRATTAIFTGLMAKIGGTGGIDFAFVGNILLGLLGLYGASALFAFVQGLLMTGVANRVGYALRRDIAHKLNRLPLQYFESRSIGDTLSRITNDVDALGQGLNQGVAQIITSAATIAGVLWMMLGINVWMTLAALLMLPLSAMIIGVVMKRSQRYFHDQQQHLGRLNGQIEEVFGGLLVIKAFNRQRDVSETFDAVNTELHDSAWRAQAYAGLMHPAMNFIGNLGYVVVAIMGGYLSMRRVIEVGDIQAFIQYVRNFTQPIAQLAQIGNMLQSMAAAAERAFELLDEPEETQAGDPLPNDGVVGDVAFSGVRFGYDAQKPVIKNFTAQIRPGQKIAIVGPTGAGKTTLVKLLMRFYDVDEGSIAIDGRDIRAYERNGLRGLFAMVLQDTWLFHGTIMENIRYGRLDATDEEVVAAARAAYAHHFIQTLPGGYNMVVNEETTNLSQGQKQLLTIARAILADNPILILDEATSSVDTRTEQRIQQAMDNLMRGRTSFIIAHRLSTIKNADLILVIDEGDIAEQGTHEALLAKGGLYAALYQSQFEPAEA
jgi:ATP-binding cassette subfamily B multidrug efflux pump